MANTQNQQPDTLQTHEVDDIEDLPEGTATLAYYSGVPCRIEFVEPADDDGVFRSAVVTYTADENQPWLFRAMSRYGEVNQCSYEYVQFDGFKSITVPEAFHAGPDDPLVALIPKLAEYMHDLLMFHRIDPPTCTFVPSTRGS